MLTGKEQCIQQRKDPDMQLLGLVATRASGIFPSSCFVILYWGLALVVCRKLRRNMLSLVVCVSPGSRLPQAQNPLQLLLLITYQSFSRPRPRKRVAEPWKRMRPALTHPAAKPGDFLPVWRSRRCTCLSPVSSCRPTISQLPSLQVTVMTPLDIC